MIQKESMMHKWERNHSPKTKGLYRAEFRSDTSISISIFDLSENINMKINIIRMQKFISIFILNGYEYNLDIRTIDIMMDIT